MEPDGHFGHTEAIDESAVEVIQAADAKLREAEAVLRELWYDTVEQSPALAARLNAATRFAHLAAEALTTKTLL